MIPIIEGKTISLMEFENAEELCKASQGTPWCTKEIYTATSYFSKGGMYLIQYKNGKKHSLLHIPVHIPDSQNVVQWNFADLNKWKEMLGGKIINEIYECGIIDFIKQKNELDFLMGAEQEINSNMLNYMQDWDIKSKHSEEVLVVLSAIGIKEFPKLVEKNILAKIMKHILFVDGQSKELEEEMSRNEETDPKYIFFYVRFASQRRLSNKKCERFVLENRRLAKAYLHFLNSTGKLKPKIKDEIFKIYKELHGEEEMKGLAAAC